MVFSSIFLRSPTMYIVFKGISTLERTDCDCSIFNSLNLKCCLCHARVNMFLNPVNGEKLIKEDCHHLIYFLSKSSSLQLEVKVSTKMTSVFRRGHFVEIVFADQCIFCHALGASEIASFPGADEKLQAYLHHCGLHSAYRQGKTCIFTTYLHLF